jgi:N6-L-threonylcarbamoyladenine synthase
LDFSFSGLKTFARNTYLKYPEEKPSIAKAFEIAATETLMIKCRRAIEKTNFSTLVVAGGVSANNCLRQTLDKMAESLNIDVYYPDLEFCTDNGAMIALAGHYRLLSGQSNDGYEIKIRPRWNLEELQAV